MAQYNYNKYTVAVNIPGEYMREDTAGARMAELYRYISFNPNGGYGQKATVSGRYGEGVSYPAGAVGYSSDGESWAYKFVAHEAGNTTYNAVKNSYYQFRLWELTPGVGTESQGSYVGSVIAEDGTYPANGKHSDGYWYVRGSVYNPNTAPTVPGKPVATGDFKPGGAIRISWPQSTDAQGQTIKYHLERREYKNGVAGSWLDTGATSLAYIDLNLPSDTTITQIEFRVRAYDTLNAYSGFSTISDKYSLTNNKVPTINLATSNDVTLFEKDTFIISGTATDADVGNIINVKYQIGAGATHAIATSISDGSTPVSFNKQLTFKESRLWEGRRLSRITW